MDHNPDDFSVYNESGGNAHEPDYAHPRYYQAQGDPDSAQSTQQWDPYSIDSQDSQNADYARYPSGSQVPSEHYEMPKEYSDPQHYELYHPGLETKSQTTEVPGETPKKRSRGLAGIGTALMAIGAWLLKFKSLLFFFKFGIAGFSAIITAALYAVIFGWPFAIGLVISLFIHEMGHALVMKIKGIPVGSMIFIPMLGAAVTMKQMPQNAKDEAEVGIAGPLAGALAASFCLFMAMSHTGSVWAPLAYFGFFINLFNLIPIVPFDGGRVLAAVDRRVWILGFLALLAYQIWSWINGIFYPWLLLFVVMAATQLWSRGMAPQNPNARAYYEVPLSSRIILTILYFGLAAVLFLGMTMAHSLMPMRTTI